MVTLEDWHTFGKPIWESFTAALRNKFASRGLDGLLLQEHPFTIASIDEFEQLALVVAERGIESTLTPKMIDEYSRTWSLQAYFQDRDIDPTESTQLLFEEEFDGLVERVRADGG